MFQQKRKTFINHNTNLARQRLEEKRKNKNKRKNIEKNRGEFKNLETKWENNPLLQ